MRTLEIYRTILEVVFVCGCETWSTTDNDKILNKWGRKFARKAHSPVTEQGVWRIGTKGEAKELPWYREGHEVENAWVVKPCNYNRSKDGLEYF
jgi:hypothetical protein